MIENKITCLLIDDDLDDQEIFAMALQDVNETFSCQTANHGKQALEKLNAHAALHPDFIFLDLNLPFMSGKQCLQEIKKNPGICHIPVIIYTTSSHNKDIEDAKQLGAAHFLIKPSRIDYLTKILSRLFQKNNLPFTLTLEI